MTATIAAQRSIPGENGSLVYVGGSYGPYGPYVVWFITHRTTRAVHQPIQLNSRLQSVLAQQNRTMLSSLVQPLLKVST